MSTESETRGGAHPEFNRRQALGGAGAVALAAILTACGSGDETSTPVTGTDGGSTAVGSKTRSGELVDLFEGSAGCTLTPEETEGPFYFDVDKIRSDIREDRNGTPLRLVLRVRGADSCEALHNAVVDIWHCDATGLYSGFESASTGGGGSSAGTDDETYLRGAQVTNADGIVQFTTVYPGWYPGRTVHIHVKVHLDNTTLLTTQLYFDDAFSSKVYAADPYAEDTGRDAFNEDDVFFDESLILSLSEEGDGVLGVMNFDVAEA